MSQWPRRIYDLSTSTFENGTTVLSLNVSGKLSVYWQCRTSGRTDASTSRNIENSQSYTVVTESEFCFLFWSLMHLRDAVWPKRPKKWKNNWILHHDDAITYSSQCRSFWQKTKFEPLLGHHILTWCEFLIFSRCKILPKGPPSCFFGVCGRNSLKHDSRSHFHAKRELPEGLQAVTGLI